MEPIPNTFSFLGLSGSKLIITGVAAAVITTGGIIGGVIYYNGYYQTKPEESNPVSYAQSDKTIQSGKNKETVSSTKKTFKNSFVEFSYPGNWKLNNTDSDVALSFGRMSIIMQFDSVYSYSKPMITKKSSVQVGDKVFTINEGLGLNIDCSIEVSLCNPLQENLIAERFSDTLAEIKTDFTTTQLGSVEPIYIFLMYSGEGESPEISYPDYLSKKEIALEILKDVQFISNDIKKDSTDWVQEQFTSNYHVVWELEHPKDWKANTSGIYEGDLSAVVYAGTPNEYSISFSYPTFIYFAERGIEINSIDEWIIEDVKIPRYYDEIPESYSASSQNSTYSLIINEMEDISRDGVEAKLVKLSDINKENERYVVYLWKTSTKNMRKIEMSGNNISRDEIIRYYRSLEI